MGEQMRQEARGYLKAAVGGWNHPEKFNTESVFQLAALAIEGFWIGWLEDRGQVPSHHAFRDFVRAAETVEPLPADLKKELLSLDRYQKLCEWIPIEPQKPTRTDLPGVLALADRVAVFTSRTLGHN